MGKSNKIVFLIGSLSGGGAEWQALIQANELATRGYEVKIIVFNGESRNYLHRRGFIISKSLNIHFINNKIKSKKVNKIYYWIRYFFCGLCFSRGKGTIVYAWLETMHLISIFIKILSFSNKQLIWCFRNEGLKDPEISSLMRKIIVLNRLLSKFSDGYIFISENSRQAYICEQNYSNKKYEIIYNIFLEHKLSHRSSDINVEKNVLNILTVGRITEVKNQLEIIKAIKMFMNTYKNDFSQIKVSFVGKVNSPGYLERLKEYVAKEKLICNIDFLGEVNNIRDFYINTDLVLLASLSEGLGNAIIEAAMYKKPVLTTDVSDVSKVLVSKSKIASPHAIDIFKTLERFKKEGFLNEELEINFSNVKKMIDKETQIDKLINFLENV